MQEFAVSLRFEKDRLAVWMKATKRRQSRYTLYMIILGILALNFLIIVPTAQEKLGPALLGLTCLALLGAVFFISRRGKQGATRVDELYNGGQEYRVFIREDGFSFKSAGRAETVAYTENLRVQEHEHYFALHYRAGGLFIVPRAAMPDARAEALSAFFKERLGKDYRAV